MNSLEFLVLIMLCFARVRQREIFSEKLCHSLEKSEAIIATKSLRFNVMLVQRRMQQYEDNNLRPSLFSLHQNSISTFPPTVGYTVHASIPITKCDLESHRSLKLQ